MTNDKLVRLASRRIAERGMFVNLVEYPAVRIGGARFRMLAMTTHNEADAREAIAKILEASEQAAQDLNTWLPDATAEQASA